MFIVGVRFRVHLFIASDVKATTCLRADAAINEVVRLVWERMAFAQCDRAGHAIARRFGTGLFATQAAGVFFLGLTVSFNCLLRVRLANRCCRVDGLYMRFRDLYVKSIRLDKGICLLPCLANVVRRHRVNYGRDEGSHFLNYVSGNVRREGVFVVSGHIGHRVALRPIFVAHPNSLPRVVGHGHVNQANARIRIFCARVSEVNAYLGDHDGEFTQASEDRCFGVFCVRLVI